jgi:hypothetical protein
MAFSFGIGILGAMFGGIQTFICTGFAGIIMFALKAAGAEVSFLGQEVLNTLLLPAIIFNGAGLSTAFAARRHPGQIEGWDITRSLIFLHDTPVMLTGGLGGMLGYLVFSLASQLGLPADAGSFSVLSVGIAGRLLLGTGRRWNPDAAAYYREQGVEYWVFQTVNATAMAVVCAILLKEAGPDYYGLGFSVSAALLIFGYAGGGQKVPTTHQITNIVGVTMGLTGGNIVVSVAFALLANVIYLLFAKYFNEECSTHIDPPAVGIEVVTLILGIIF